MECVRRFPGRFSAVVIVDTDQPEAPQTLERLVHEGAEGIRLGQMANILPWWHPIRVAEQAAMLDVISGGRLEFGIGRGYQPREAEVFGRPFGATIQDQERNRAYYHATVLIVSEAASKSAPS